jgi:YegS/Rv2252/BmrU family lipid kinase
MTEPWHVLINKAAGRRGVDPRLLTGLLREAAIPSEISIPGSVDEMHRGLIDLVRGGARRVAVVGGDGTANLAVNVFMAFSIERRPLLAVLPAGTGCDLLRTFAIPQKLQQAIEHLKGDRAYRIDVGRLEGAWGTRYFVNVAQAGVGAAAAESAQDLSRSWGKARYPLAFLMRLPRFPAGKVVASLGDRTHEGSALAVVFANGQFFAGGWNVAPRSTVQDGRLDLQVINAAKWEAIRLVPKIIRGLHLTDRAVRRYAVAGCSLETEHPWPIEADGELVGNTPVRVTVEPGALDLKI